MDHNSRRPRRLGDFGDSYYRGDSFPQPETAPHPYFPELERERANAPHGLPMVSASESVLSASFSSLTVKSWRLDFPLLARAVRHSVACLLRTQAFKKSATTCHSTFGRMRSLSTTLRTLLLLQVPFQYLECSPGLTQG
jgi:hypothetical protein